MADSGAARRKSNSTEFAKVAGKAIVKQAIKNNDNNQGSAFRNTNAVGKIVGDIVAKKTSGLQGQGGVLGGQHAGGHSDVSGMSTTNIGGSVLKTPVIKPGSTKNK